MLGNGTPTYYYNTVINVPRYGFIDRVALGTYYYVAYSSTERTVATTGLFTSNNISMRIMKGAIPTSFSEIPNDLARYSDCLVDWFILNNPDYSSTSKIQFEASSNPVKLFTEFEPARLSGTATWFWFISWYDRSAIDTYSSFYGTVGLPGSGADLIVGNTNIVQNTQYRISELLINIPSSWTY